MSRRAPRLHALPALTGRLTLLSVLAALIFAACGGGAAPAGGAGGAGASPAATTAAAAEATDTAEETETAEETDTTGGTETAEPGGEGEGDATTGLCPLVSAADVAAAAGAEVATTTGAEGSCTWTLSDLRTINARLDASDSIEGAKLLFPQGRPVPGLGDDSWWGVDPEGGLLSNILYARKGDATYAVQLVLFPNEDQKNEAIAVAIMRKLLERV